MAFFDFDSYGRCHDDVACSFAHTEFEVERRCRKVDEIPFDFTRKRMSVVVEYEGDHVLICKGAVEDVFKACASYQVDEEVFPLIDMIRQDVLEDYEEQAGEGGH